MKHDIIKICLVVVATLLSFGCNDSFLDRQPLDEISNESFWNTENDLAVYNNSLYDLARNDNDVPIFMAFDDGFDSHRYGIWHLSGFSDDTAPRHSRHNNYQKVRAGRHTIPNDPFWYGWRGWNFLRGINVGMDNYGNANVSDEARSKYIGEARLMRGWFYADKISKFGAAQWVDTELNVDDEDILYGQRDDRQLVMEKVLEDLNFACQWIPDDWGDGGGPGRINRWGALLVKSRVCLFEGTWRKYHGVGSDADMWLQEAADAAKELMDNGPYSLYTNDPDGRNYNGLHRIPDDLTGNPEVIYWRRYERGIFTNHVQSYHRGYNGGATKSMVEDYLCTDGLPITLSPLYKGDAVYEDIFVDRDPRLRQTILHPEDQAIYRYGNHDFDVYPYPRVQGMPGGQKTYTGYHIIKVYDVNTAHASYNSSQTPAITMRFAEALLNYAEAKAELGTITQADLDVSVNLLRDRVSMPHLDISNVPVDPRYTSWHGDPLIVEIRRERRVELFMEGFRYDDLRRWKWGKMLENKDYGMRWDQANRDRVDPTGDVTVGYSTVDGVEYLEVYQGTDYENPLFDESKHYLWPLPLSALSQNPNLGQNPGW
ncbi:MAG: RagB/SusD family nutrient uptake outer membrane protein [Cytophagales bacterium]|nr:RagB/SusD family nutrient uptake outer membrane protein [Cytophagales bacterium]